MNDPQVRYIEEAIDRLAEAVVEASETQAYHANISNKIELLKQQVLDEVLY